MRMTALCHADLPDVYQDTRGRWFMFYLKDEHCLTSSKDRGQTAVEHRDRSWWRSPCYGWSPGQISFQPSGDGIICQNHPEGSLHVIRIPFLGGMVARYHALAWKCQRWWRVCIFGHRGGWQAEQQVGAACSEEDWQDCVRNLEKRPA